MIYLACPYSHKDERMKQLRFEKVTRVTALLNGKGFPTFSPITHSHPQEQYLLHWGHDEWLGLDRLHFDNCLELYVLCLPGWESSRGVKQEISWAKKESMPITHIDEDLNEVPI